MKNESVSYRVEINVVFILFFLFGLNDVSSKSGSFDVKFGVGVAVGSNAGDGIRCLGRGSIEIGLVIFWVDSLLMKRDIGIVRFGMRLLG
eukprot:scaffold2701_cov41-Cyclotella_meneghiniana.AAC.1